MWERFGFHGTARRDRRSRSSGPSVARGKRERTRRRLLAGMALLALVLSVAAAVPLLNLAGRGPAALATGGPDFNPCKGIDGNPPGSLAKAATPSGGTQSNPAPVLPGTTVTVNITWDPAD